MTASEFSNEFDILLNSYAKDSSEPIQLNEYEKSIYLTQAQEDMVLNLYRGINVYREGFEGNEDIRKSLDALIATKTLHPATSLDRSDYSKDNACIDGDTATSTVFKIPDDVMFIIYEYASTLNKDYIPVIPTTYDEYHRIKNNPFRGVSSNRILRFDRGDSMVELKYNKNVDSYTIKYISTPPPIILEDFPSNISINGVYNDGSGSKISTCILNPIVHREILKNAVNIALRIHSIVQK